MSAELLGQIGGPLAGVGVAMLLIATARQLRLAGLAVATAGTALVLIGLLPDGHAAQLAVAAVVGALALALGAAALARWPWALAFLALALAPARIPVAVGDTEANLLVPLYVVIGSGVLALAWALARGDERAAELGPLRWPVGVTVAWLGVSAAWAEDSREASIDVLFFLVPFALLALLVARLPWRRAPLRWLFAQLIAMAALFAGVGIYQWLARDIFWNPKVEVGNIFQSFFRVNSLFWDPSIYGRFLVVALLAALVVLLASRAERAASRWLLVAIAGTWVGLLFSFSQSSFAALTALAAVLALAAWRWHALIALALVAAVLVPVVAFTPPFERTRTAIVDNPDRATGGRFDQMKSGARIARDNPVVGVGLGGYLEAFAEEEGLRRAPARAALHATPVTVAAENGFVGLALYAWFVVSGLVAASRIGSASTLAATTARVGGVTLGAIIVHSFFYNAFFEDPMMWAALGLVGLAFARARSTEQGEPG